MLTCGFFLLVHIYVCTKSVLDPPICMYALRLVFFFNKKTQFNVNKQSRITGL